MPARDRALGVGVVAFRAGRTHWQTLVFTTVFSQMVLAIGVRSESQSISTVGLRSNLAMLGAVVLSVVRQHAVVYVPVLKDNLQHHLLAAG